MYHIVMLIVFLLVVVVHEVAHGYAALWLGDPTARDAGRLSFNPGRHMDPIGTVMVPALLLLARSPVVIGWAKPVPIDPRNFNDPVKGVFLTSLAGPLSNFLLAVAFSGLLRLNHYFLGVELLYLIAFLGVFISLFLGLFNLIPIPPLDGSGILAALLPERARLSYARMGRYGFIILIAFLYMGLVDRVLLPAVNMMTGLLIGRVF